MQDMGRGVTSIPGTGMYTGKTHSILMCALTVTEIPQIKALVAEVDPKAFVVVMPAQEVLGYGFMPLQDERLERYPMSILIKSGTLITAVRDLSGRYSDRRSRKSSRLAPIWMYPTHRSSMPRVNW